MSDFCSQTCRNGRIVLILCDHRAAHHVTDQVFVADRGMWAGLNAQRPQPSNHQVSHAPIRHSDPNGDARLQP